MTDLRRLLILYPRAWRARYGEEMSDLLAARPQRRSDAVDLVRGALDAHLHPPTASRIPALAAVTAGAAWLVVAIGVLGEPVAPDWPGLLAWTLPPAAIAAAASVLALAGVILRVGAGPSPVARAAVAGALVGAAGLSAALTVAAIGGPYGAITGAALSLAGVGTVGCGVVAAGRGAMVPGTLVAIAGVAWLLPAPIGWLTAAAAWSTIGAWSVMQRAAQAASIERRR
jgi:hypothetical protein